MNLYKLHNNPTSLKHHDKANDNIPDVFYDNMHKNPGDETKRKIAIGKSKFHTEDHIQLKHEFKPFPEGENTIAKHPDLSFYYARDNIKRRFPEAEPAIIKDEQWAKPYMIEVIKGPWPEAKDAINKSGPSTYDNALKQIEEDKS